MLSDNKTQNRRKIRPQVAITLQVYATYEQSAMVIDSKIEEGSEALPCFPGRTAALTELVRGLIHDQVLSPLSQHSAQWVNYPLSHSKRDENSAENDRL